MAPGSGIQSGPTAGSLAPALWDTLRESVLWAEAEWERVIQHASGAEEATAHLAQLCRAIRQEVAGLPAETSAVPRNALSRRWLGPHPHRLSGAGAARCRRPIRHSSCRCSTPSNGWASTSRPTGRSTSPTGSRRPTVWSWWWRSPTIFARRSPRFCFWRRPCSGAAAARSTRSRSASSGSIYSAAFGLSSVASDVIELARGGDRLVDLDPIPFSVTRHSGVGAGYRPADRGGEEPDGAADRAGDRLPNRSSGGAEPGAAQPDHQCPQVHRRGLRRGDRRPARPPGP